jgi:tRNA 5-methylaminomethyl-2-thiouridine biosynthesis bifunctional protein
MSIAPRPAYPSPVIWDEDGAPRSRAFGDVYFSLVDGLAESRAVYLEGCGLPDAWRGRRRFVVGELGFGSGLNVLALLDLWRRNRPPGAHLQIFSVEAFPMSAEDAGRALAAWPQIADLAAMLLERWPRRAGGFHRVDFPGLGASLDLAVMDALDALQAWSGAADAWFLDGFSPACNPGMWSPAVLAAVAHRSATGARAATFTVAGAVRRGLEAQGFTVERRPGFGVKRQRLEAWLPASEPAERRGPTSVIIIGAGVAGAALARAFGALGVRSVVIEDGVAGASSNPAALVMPRLDAGGADIAQLYAQAFARAADLFADQPQAILSRGVMQLEVGPKDASRFERIAASDLFEPDAVERWDGPRMAAALGEPDAPAGLYFRDAAVIEPAAVLGGWLSGVEVRRAHVAAIEPSDGAWRILDAQGVEIARAEVVCLACGIGAAALAPDAPLSPVRGQVSMIASSDRPAAAIGDGYVVATRDGFLFGATHDRGDAGGDVREQDHARNLALLARVRPLMAARTPPALLGGQAGVRAVTPDFLPLAGALEPPGLFILSGLGSRGFCAAPLLAEHVAALALDAASPLPRNLADIVDPRRFAARRNRRLGRLRTKPPRSGIDRAGRTVTIEETQG